MMETRILIVEDQRISAEDLRFTLERLGYTIADIVSSGEDAVRAEEKLRPDLIMMDVMLRDEMTGIEAAKIIKDRNGAPVIYLTAYADQETIERIKTTEPYGYIVKPYQDKELRGIIETALYKHGMELQLRQSEKRFRSLTENIPDIIIRLNRDWKIIYANPAIKSSVHRVPDDLVGRFIDEFGLPDKYIHFWKERVEQVFKSGQPFETEFAISIDTGEFIFDTRLVPEVNEKGDVNSVICIFRNITERRRTEENYRMLFTHIQDGFLLFSVRDLGDYQCVAINPAFEQMFQIGAEGLLGNDFRTAFPGWSKEWIAHFDRALTTTRPQRFEFSGRRSSSSYAVKIFYPQKSLLAVIVENITQQKKAEEAMLLAERATRLASLGTLAAGISHEINQPLTAIKLKVDGPLYWGEENEALLQKNLLQNLKFISRESDTIDELIKHMRSLSRQEETPEIQPVVLNEIIHRGLSLISHQMEAHGIELVLELDETIHDVPAHETSLEQIVINLTVNAIRAHDKVKKRNKWIRVKTYPHDSIFILEVEDNGPGIPEEDMSRIFDPFFTTSSGSEGMGLGLTIIQNLVEGFNGTIRALHSDSGGARFQVEIPMVQAGSREES